MFALLEFLHQLLEQRQGLGLALALDQRVGQIEVDDVAIGEEGIVIEDLTETIDGARVPFLAVDEEPALLVRLAEAVARLA